ncbi:hypothetical protein MF271_19960 (plasmid) [Deinococcus sp. KNUC1210]|uniref:hypothetical protein n=1 Tax=Deinococcus sp. KNUC1210 TaxID=2917691 RepID=UPI001EEF85CB|nr:hypothetical protein [Deinococcus sp. KNUC1210]ULH17690.1 hypothetical protein MF271_19960 [Deinococcus sp. KNUC1210]
MSSAAGTKYLITAALFALTLALEPLLGAGPADRAGRRRRNRGVVFVVAALVIYGAVWLLLLAMRTLVG